MKRVIHHVKRHTRSVGSHLKDHHKKYMFGLISAALLYKAVSLILAAIFVNNVWMHYSYADDIQDPIDTETEIIEEIESDDELVDEWDDELPSSNWICGPEDIIFLRPLSGEILRWDIDMEWEYENTDCIGSSFIIKLRDANTQYVTIWTANYSNTWSIFDSSLLYSWFYNITWLNASGNEIVLHTWQYLWVNTRYFSWHKIVMYLSNMDVLYEWDDFTIDNEIPTLDNVNLIVTWVNSGYVWLNTDVLINFDSSEELTGITVNVLGTNALLTNKSWNNYTYSMGLSVENTQWNIVYNIEFEDLAWNTGYVEWSSNVKFDRTIPAVTELIFTRTWDYIKLQLDTNELSKLNFIYTLSWNNTWYSYDTQYLTSHTYMFSGVNTWQYYNYSISIRDFANNIWYVWWYFKLSGDTIDYTYDNIGSGEMLVSLWFNTWDINTGDINTWSMIQKIIEEIEKFKACRESITDLNNINIPIRSYSAAVKMPEFDKSYVKKLVSAFSIVLFDRVGKVWLNQSEINIITSEFNDFLIILKLIQDDENQCEQNLSNHYMSKFKNTLEKYNLTEN